MNMVSWLGTPLLTRYCRLFGARLVAANVAEEVALVAGLERQRAGDPTPCLRASCRCGSCCGR